MALDDRDIFKAIWERFPDQPVEFVMEQYAKARRLNMEIERSINQTSEIETTPEIEEEASVDVEIDAAPVAQRRKLNKRRFKVKPEDSITDDAIYCCVCGEKLQSLTVKHLAKHETTPEEYKKVCGFPANLPLMSHKRLAKSKEIIERAQQARLAKRAAAMQE